MATLNLVPASAADYRRLAERRLPRQLFDYLDGGAFSEATLHRNCSDFDALPLRQTVMRDVSQRQTDTRVFDQTLALPLILAPIGMGGFMARRAETQAKRAADTAGIPFCLSTVGVCSIEEVAAVSETPFWFQLYMLRDRSAVQDMLSRARAADVDTLVFTVDLAVAGSRYRDVRNAMGANASPYARLRGGPLSYLLHPGWAWDVGIRGRPHTFGTISRYTGGAGKPADFKGWLDSQLDPSVTWEDIAWLRSQWSGNLIIKGILNPDDARAAVAAGADAIVVSNHGGRQLDGVSSSIQKLTAIVDAVGGQTRILLDSGVRTGQDILKALALGADATLMGRPWVYAVAADGSDGVAKLLETIRVELSTSMALTGVTTIEQISKEVLDVP